MSVIHFLKFLVLKTFPCPQEIPIPSVGDCGDHQHSFYFLELHKFKELLQNTLPLLMILLLLFMEALLQILCFLNSLVTHQVKTMKITTVKEVWIPGLN